MEVNLNKIKVMVVNERQIDNQSNKEIKCKNIIVEKVTISIYLEY